MSLFAGKLDPGGGGRGVVEDDKLFILNMIYKHLEKPNSDARSLFANFTSAVASFSKMQPLVLIDPLGAHLNLLHQLLLSIFRFLTHRKRRVLVNGAMSDVLISNTGTPQGSVLSPLLFSFIHRQLQVC